MVRSKLWVRKDIEFEHVTVSSAEPLGCVTATI